MREILFRGKRTDNGEWVYGYLAYRQSHNRWYIIINDPIYEWTFYIVDPGTVGQCCELFDKGKVYKIFEGDVIETNVAGQINRGVVVYQNGVFCLEYNKQNCYGIDFIFIEECRYFQLIGNIYDNPELMEENK